MRIPLSTTLIFTRNFARLVHECDLPVGRAPKIEQHRRPLTPRIYEVQPYTSFAMSIALFAVVAMWQCFVALQVPLSARETASAHTLGLRSLPVPVAVPVGIRFGVISRSHSHDLLRWLRPRRVGRVLALLRRNDVFGRCAHRRVAEGGGRKHARRRGRLKPAIVARLQICRLVRGTGQCNKTKARRPSSSLLQSFHSYSVVVAAVCVCMQ